MSILFNIYIIVGILGLLVVWLLPLIFGLWGRLPSLVIAKTVAKSAALVCLPNAVIDTYHAILESKFAGTEGASDADVARFEPLENRYDAVAEGFSAALQEAKSRFFQYALLMGVLCAFVYMGASAKGHINAFHTLVFQSLFIVPVSALLAGFGYRVGDSVKNMCADIVVVAPLAILPVVKLLNWTTVFVCQLVAGIALFPLYVLNYLRVALPLLVAAVRL